MINGWPTAAEPFFRPPWTPNWLRELELPFLAVAYGRINSTLTLPNQVGWPMAKELLFTARVVEAEEAYRIGLLNHLVRASS